MDLGVANNTELPGNRSMHSFPIVGTEWSIVVETFINKTHWGVKNCVT